MTNIEKLSAMVRVKLLAGLSVATVLASCGGGGSGSADSATSVSTASSVSVASSSVFSTVASFSVDPPQAIWAAIGDQSVTISWTSLAGAYHGGYLVTSNIYVSTTPNINPAKFVEDTDHKVIRGRNILLPVVFTGLTNYKPLYTVATDNANGVESLPSTEVTVTPQPPATLVEHMAALNDTGIDLCASADQIRQPCPQSGLPGQDADQGRDASERNHQLKKVGLGVAGFDFTKLDSSAAPLPDYADSWDCVKDNVTQLWWEAKSSSKGLRWFNNVYTWFEPDVRFNGGFAGQQGGGVCTGSACDTFAYLKALNTQGVCGFHDWRIPTRREIYSLVSLRTYAFDSHYFPLIPNSDFWTSTVAAGTAMAGCCAWRLDGGELVVYRKVLASGSLDFPAAIIAVRSEAAP